MLAGKSARDLFLCANFRFGSLFSDNVCSAMEGNFFIFSSLECVLFVDHHLCVRRGLDAAQSAKFWKGKVIQVLMTVCQE